MTNHPLTIIKASAGSGKTYNLAKLYIEQLLFTRDAAGHFIIRKARCYHEHILAITFTNMATAEMKQRIVKELNVLAGDTTASAYYEDFAANLSSAEPALEIRTRAADALRDILLNYSTFNVSTIDSFFQMILRTFARELDRDYDYDLQVDADYVNSTVVGNFLRSLGATHRRSAGGAEVERWVRDLIKQNVDNEKSWRSIYRGDELLELCRSLSREEFRAAMDEIRTYFYGTATPAADAVLDLSRIKRFIEQIDRKAQTVTDEAPHDIVQQFLDTLARYGYLVSDLHGGGALKVLSTPESILKAITGTNKPDNTVFKRDKFTIASVPKCFKGAAAKHAVEDGFYADIVEVADEVLRAYAMLSLCKDLKARMGMLALIGVIDREMQTFREENNAVLIADTNELINRIVSSADDVPFMYERVGTTIEHYMIDEFQDTSRRQYENFTPLLDEAMSHATGAMNLIIGDSKQAIYRFRNADPMLFLRTLQHDMAGRYSEHNLGTNYRSLRNVVSFNNEVIGQLVAHYTSDGLNPTLHATYGVSHEPQPEYVQAVDSRKDEVGYGMVRVINTMGVFDTGNGTEEPFNEAKVLEILPAYLLEARERLGKWGGIGILVNTNVEGKKIVNAVLNHNDSVARSALSDERKAQLTIPIASDEAMYISNSPSVNLIIALLRFIDLTRYAISEEPVVTDDSDEGDDARMRRRVMRKREREQRLYALLQKFISRSHDIKAADGEAAGTALDECLQELNSDDTLRQTVLDCLPNDATEPMTMNNIIDRLVHHFIIKQQGNKADAVFLLALQDLAASFASLQGTNGTLREFLQYWDARGNRVSVGSGRGADAVQVLTIHKSKGLEFDCVMIPMCDWFLDGNTMEHFYWVKGKTVTDLLDIDDESIIPPLVPVQKSSVVTLLAGATDRYPALSRTVGRMQENLLIDLMNKTYVAFTRPRHEMHLFLPYNDKNDYTRVSTLLEQVMQQLCAEAVENPDALQVRLTPERELVEFARRADELSRLLYGINEPPYYSDTLPSTTAYPDSSLHWWSVGSTAGVYRPKTDDEAQVNSLTLDGNDLAYRPMNVMVALPKNGDSALSRELGRRVHAVLSNIEYPSDIDRAITGALTRGVVSLDTNSPWHIDRMRERIIDMVTNPPAMAQWGTGVEPSEAPAWWASDNIVLNERTISNIVDGEVETKRPDRVVIRPDGTVIVVDYKTGTMADSSAATAHLEQVRHYARLLQAALTPPAVRAYLWYTTAHEIERVV